MDKLVGLISVAMLAVVGCAGPKDEMNVSCDTDACADVYPEEQASESGASEEEGGASGTDSGGSPDIDEPAATCRSASDEAACDASGREMEECQWQTSQVVRYADGACEQVEERGVCTLVSRGDEGCEYFPSSWLQCDGDDNPAALIAPVYDIDGAFEILIEPDACTSGDIPWRFTPCDPDAGDYVEACDCAC